MNKTGEKVWLSENLFNVDRQNIKYNNLSFTYLHWALVQQIGTGELQITDIYEN